MKNPKRSGIPLSRARTLLLAACGTAFALGQTTVSEDLNFKVESFYSSNSFVLSQTGSAGTLGNATLLDSSSVWPIANNSIAGPAQVSVFLRFNEVDAFTINYSLSDPTFNQPQTVTMSGGTISGGTGAYAGATGSLNLTIVKDAANALISNATTTGSGTVTVGGKSTPLTLSNFRGTCCGYPMLREHDYFTTTFNASGSLGNATGTMVSHYFLSIPNPVVTTAGTLTFNSADSMNLWFRYNPTSANSVDPPASFTGFVEGGTGKYANVGGQVTFSPNASGLHIAGSISTFTLGGTVTQVKTVYGLPKMTINTWLEIHGKNLVPPDTPSTGVDWSNAPDFANGTMPTQLGPIKVVINGQSAFIYYYCSAITNPNCADDQINVLAPSGTLGKTGNPLELIVTNGSANSTPFTVFFDDLSPAFFALDLVGHVAARHQDSSLVGPASLYPGYTTGAKVGEIISVYGTGFGQPQGTPIVNGSSTQSGTLGPAGLSCWISGLSAPVAAALVSPGLYQFNITVPKGLTSGDNPLNCVYNTVGTYAGALVAVQ